MRPPFSVSCTSTAAPMAPSSAKASDPIDFAVGVSAIHSVGTAVERGEPLLRIHARSAASLQAALPLIEAAVHGLGVALVPDFLVRPELAEGRLVAFAAAKPGVGAYYLVWPRGREWYPPLQAFRAWIERLGR